MLRIQDVGAVAYGGAVTFTEWWDNKRIQEGKLATKDVLKKASFYTYLGVGLIATLSSAFGWLRRYEGWTEKIATGFLYDLPRFAVNISKSMGASGKAESAAVREAQRILNQRATAKALTQGRVAERTYEPEFNTVGVV